MATRYSLRPPREGEPYRRIVDGRGTPVGRLWQDADGTYAATIQGRSVDGFTNIHAAFMAAKALRRGFASVEEMRAHDRRLRAEAAVRQAERNSGGTVVGRRIMPDAFYQRPRPFRLRDRPMNTTDDSELGEDQ